MHFLHELSLVALQIGAANQRSKIGAANMVIIAPVVGNEEIFVYYSVRFKI